MQLLKKTLLLLFIPTLCFASASLDQKFQLETVGVLRAWDNVDGLFAEYVRDSFQTYFEGQSRFRYQDISRSDEILSGTKIPYEKVIKDRDVLNAVSRKFSVQTLIRTKVYKEGPFYRFVLDWLHAPKIFTLSTHEFSIREPVGGSTFDQSVIQENLHKGVDELIQKVPFVAHVTGVNRDWVTVNIGKNVDLKIGDSLIVETLAEAKEHPLLHSIVGWRFREVGRLIVEDIDQRVAFCRVENELKGRKISRYQKITRIIPGKRNNLELNDYLNKHAEMEKEDLTEKPPKLGYVSGGLILGSGSRELGSGATGKSGGGLIFGGAAKGQIWITKTLFLDLGFKVGSTSFGLTNLDGSGTEASVGGSFSQFEMAFGYHYLLKRSFFGPKAWGRIGFRRMSYSMSTSTTNLTTPTTFTGSIFIGAGIDVPIRNTWGALLDVNVSLIKSAEENPSITGAVSGSSDVSIFAGGYRRLNQRMTLRAGFGLIANSADFTAGSSLTHRNFFFMPSLLYYF